MSGHVTLGSKTPVRGWRTNKHLQRGGRRNENGEKERVRQFYAVKVLSSQTEMIVHIRGKVGKDHHNPYIVL